MRGTAFFKGKNCRRLRERMAFMEKMYHIGMDASLNADYALLPGDPGRVEKIAALLDEPEFYARNREYTSYVGTLEGRRVLVMSTGMGGPSTAIAIEELHKIGVKTAIRVGTCGGIDLKVKGGDVVVAQAAIRMEGTSREYLPIEFPAVGDFTVTKALASAAAASGRDYHVGVVHCKDSFYGQHDPERMPVSYELLQKWSAWQKAHTLASEMESAAMFTVGQVLGMRCGCILHTIWNKDRLKQQLPDREDHDMTAVLKAAIEALRILMRNESA